MKHIHFITILSIISSFAIAGGKHNQSSEKTYLSCSSELSADGINHLMQFEVIDLAGEVGQVRRDGQIVPDSLGMPLREVTKLDLSHVAVQEIAKRLSINLNQISSVNSYAAGNLTDGSGVIAAEFKMSNDQKKSAMIFGSVYLECK